MAKRRKKQRQQTTRQTSTGVVLENIREVSNASKFDALWERLEALPKAFFTEQVAEDYQVSARLLIVDEHEAAEAILTELEEMVTLGRRTGNTDGELEEGWNTQTNKYEFKHPVEWARMQGLEGPPPEPEVSWLDNEKEFPPLPGAKPTPKPDPRGKTPMKKVGGVQLDPGVKGQGPNPEQDKGLAARVRVASPQWLAAAEARLRIERQATALMRAEWTDNLNNREGVQKKGLEDNCKMAAALAGALKNKKLLEPGGLFCRIVGEVEGQGQFAEADPEAIANDIAEAAARLERGEGTGDDGNKVMQFIGCFVDGLTEVTEGKATAKAQFDELWPQLGLGGDDVKKQLLDRVDGYKQLAGAASDTLSGKTARKGDTREGFMPNDPRKQLEASALIKNDLSGSMHSALMAQELAESLFGGGSIKAKGAPVLLRNKDLINARASDALAITAGGRGPEKYPEDVEIEVEGRRVKMKKGDPVMKGGKKVIADQVLHTAFEMINGMRGITGSPPVSQSVATEIMDRMTGGESFTDVMEALYPDVDFAWQAVQ